MNKSRIINLLGGRKSIYGSLILVCGFYLAVKDKLTDTSMYFLLAWLTLMIGGNVLSKFSPILGSRK